MRFSYNWLQSYFKKQLPAPEKLAELLTLHFAEVEEVKKQGADFVLDIDVRPNRAGDCFSHIGIAREIAAVLNYKLQIINHKPIEDKNLRTKDFVSVAVKNNSACPRYAARVISGVGVGPSQTRIKEKLESCGLRSINNVVDIANYVMLETGQPLHAFDFDKIKTGESKNRKTRNPKKIIVRFAREGEKITTLDGESYDLEKNILVVSDEESPLAIAGIKGGKKAEIDENTKTIILESANFDREIIRMASKAIDLKTDASWRFEHGLDPNLAEIAISEAAALIQKTAGGKIARGAVDVYPVKNLPKKIKLDLNCVKSLLGVEIPEQRIRSILKKLEFKAKNSMPAGRQEKLKVLEVEIPTRRLDVILPEDLTEEIGRIYGYENITAFPPRVFLAPPERNEEIFLEDFLKDILKEAGFSEVWSYSFISDTDKEIMKYGTELVEAENYLSSDFRYLRPSLIPWLLKNIAKNQKNFKEIIIFELGKTYARETDGKKGGQIAERRMLAGAMAGDKFYEIKGAIDLLLNKSGAREVSYSDYRPGPEESKMSFWSLQKCAEIKIGRTTVGFLGEIIPRVLSGFEVGGKATMFELDFEKLQKLSSFEREYRPLSRFPSAVRDIAVLVPKMVKIENVLARIRNGGGGLISDVELFDVYEGENFPEGKKNVAFHIIFQAEDRTLKPEEIDELQNKIIKALEENVGWEVRK